LPSPTILQGDDYFNAVLYTGNEVTGRAITGVGFQPDFVWAKARNNAQNHTLFNSVVGATKYLNSNTTTAESTNGETLQSFDADGYTLGDAFTNETGYTYVSWNWKASNAAAVSNVAGTITSSVSANTTAGFSIVTYTGNATGGATIGHGLGVAPRMVIVKNRSNAGKSWCVYTAMVGNTGALFLNSTSATDTSTSYWNNTSPTSTVFSVGTSTGMNGSGQTYVAYCFSEVAGYSKFGSYTGNGSTDGPFVYLGFTPKFVMVKDVDGNNWEIYDTTRSPFNVIGRRLFPSNADAENTGEPNIIDAISNGFKIRGSYGGVNASGRVHIYACFAENPFKNALAR
jgi:hypothetical protein